MFRVITPETSVNLMRLIWSDEIGEREIERIENKGKEENKNPTKGAQEKSKEKEKQKKRKSDEAESHSEEMGAAETEKPKESEPQPSEITTKYKKEIFNYIIDNLKAVIATPGFIKLCQEKPFILQEMFATMDQTIETRPGKRLRLNERETNLNFPGFQGSDSVDGVKEPVDFWFISE